MKNNKIFNNWMLAEDIPNCDLFFSQFWLHCFVNDFVKNTGRAYNRILCKYEGYHLWFYFDEKDSYQVGENIVNRIVDEDGYTKKINDNIILVANKLRKYCDGIPQTNLDKLSNDELWKIYNTQNQIHNDFYTWCWIPTAADMFHNNLTRRVKEYLKSTGIKDEKLNEYFVILTQPAEKSLIFIEQQELLDVAVVIQRDENLSEIFKRGDIERIKGNLSDEVMKLLQEHKAKYHYMKGIFIPATYETDDYLKQLIDMFKIDILPSELKQKQLDNLKVAKIKKDNLLDELNLENKWRNIFVAFGNFMVTKIYRRYAQVYAIYQMDAILKEIARRNYITVKQVRFMLHQEVRAMLLEGWNSASGLLDRTKFCVYYADKENDSIYIKDEAKNILKTVEKEIDKNIERLEGEIGCPGYGKGEVKIIIRAEDMKKMNQGDILVSIATDPDIVPAMKKAAAIVTEQGGVTSHAAIVSRELNIPCVIGTKIATKVFKDGDMVEVDANKGTVVKAK